MAEFSWAAGADVGLGLAGAFSSWASASAKSIVAEANAEAQNTVRTAQNQQRVSALSLAATMRSISDRAILTNGGEQVNAATVTLARTQEAYTRGNFEQGLRFSEQLGAQTARSAAAGVGGSSVAAVSYSMRLQQARLAEQMQERQGQVTYDMLKQRSGIMPAATSRMDLSPLNANQDYSANTAPSSSSGMDLVGALTEGLLKKAPSLQVALDSISTGTQRPLPTTGDFTRMDRADYTGITIS